MPLNPRWRSALGTLVLLAVAAGSGPCLAADAAAKTPPLNSALDAPLLYQLLIGEIELGSGEPGAAYEVILDAARRTGDDQLFKRAVDIALQAHAGDQALTAARAWHSANPKSLDALRLELQILSALNRLGEAVKPAQDLLALTPQADRGSLIAALPRFVEHASDRKQGAELLEKILRPDLDLPATRVAARVAVGRGWLAAQDPARALDLARQAHLEAPAAPGPALLALELMPSKPEAETIVTDT
ncbi:MAG: hypothetical protein KGM91_20705, partial [Burkholderiales bacterium]|nr:hypothetical protein [Burkholderiales bacterium]